MSETPPSATPASPLKRLLRPLIAVVLLAVVLVWFVSWHDTLTWKSRYPAGPLHGHIEVVSSTSRFVVDAGELRGTTFDFERHENEIAIAAVVVTPPGGAPERVAADVATREELKQQPQEGLITTFARLLRAPAALAGAFLLFVVASMISFQRWHVLLRSVRVDARVWRVQKLGFIGLFFSNIIPGLTGGDLVKAIMVARDHPEQRPAAVLSVIVDRVIGLLGLALVASGALVFQDERFAVMKKNLNLILLAIVAGALVVLSKRLRRLFRIDRLLKALPFAEVLHKLDHAALLYRARPLALAYSVVVSLAIHGMILTEIGVLGRAIGIQIPWLDFYSLAPLALIVQSLPISPGGIGVGELAFMFLFARSGVPGSAAFALSFSYRAVQMVVSLIGGVLMAAAHEPPPSQREFEEEAKEERELEEETEEAEEESEVERELGADDPPSGPDAK